MGAVDEGHCVHQTLDGGTIIRLIIHAPGPALADIGRMTNDNFEPSSLESLGNLCRGARKRSRLLARG
jgi:hypothetical protein